MGDRVLSGLGWLALIIVLAVFWHFVAGDCYERGGQIMQNAWGGYECAKPLK